MASLQNDIYVGSVSAPLYHFTNENIEVNGAKGSFAVDVIANELSVDQFTAVIRPSADQLRAKGAFITSDGLDFYTADDDQFFVLSPTDESKISDTPYVDSVANMSTNGVSFKLLTITGILTADSDSWDECQHVGTNDNSRRNIGVGSVYSSANVVAALLQNGNEQRIVFVSLSSGCVGSMIYRNYNGNLVVPTSGGMVRTYSLTSTYTASGKTVYYNSNNWSYINTAMAEQTTYNIPYYGSGLSIETLLEDALDYLTKAHSGYYPGDDDALPFDSTIPYGTPVTWRVDNSFMAKGYAKSIDRISKYGYKLTCISGVGLLDGKMHTGGIYQNKLVVGTPGNPGLLNEIIGDTLEFVPSQDLDGVTITGHLPYDTARNNLHRVLFAIGAVLNFGRGIADYFIGYPVQVAQDIPSSKIALQGSVSYQLPANKTEITEHAFFETADEPEVTLYESESSVTNLIVMFDAPVITESLTASEHLTINKSHVNYAVVSGYGTLTGKPYTHTTQVQVLTDNPRNDPERVKRVSDNELINSLNSHNVAMRVLSYFGATQTVKTKTVFGSDFHTLRPGYLYNLVNPYGEVARGYLAKQEALVTSVVGSQCQFITGYLPNANGNTFTKVYILDAKYVAEHGNTFTVPEGKTYIRLVLIAGGDGGNIGSDGADGLGSESIVRHTISQVGPTFAFYTDRYVYENAEQAAAQGGAPGTAGLPGKVYITEKTVTSEEEISFTLGAGGDGGNSENGGDGKPGEATTASSPSLGLISSEDGARVIGYNDPLTGNTYATPGEDGIKGGDGGQTDITDLYGCNGKDGRRGGNVGNNTGGTPGTGYEFNEMVSHDGYNVNYKTAASGGGSGGAAYGANGGNGTNGGNMIGNPSQRGVTTGSGGDGADAVAPTKPTYGCGGHGGHGGGGGGNAAGAEVEYWNNYHAAVTIGTGGKGGKGSSGSAGGDGVLLIYV